MKNLWHRRSVSYGSKIWWWGLICLGVVVRIFQYLFNRSLWLDEAGLAVNIVNRSFLELFRPLDCQQAAPIGFLLVEKCLVQLFGNNEYVLRLFPFICGVASLFLFYKLTRDYIQTRTVLLPVGLLAISALQVRYSSEVKQYSTDMAVALLLYNITFWN